MVIIRTKPLADIIQAVSAGSILDAAACASAGEAAKAELSATAAPATMRASVVFLVMVSPSIRPETILQSVDVGLARPDAKGLLNRSNEYLAVSNLASLGGGGDRFDDRLDAIGRHRDLDADLRQEIHGVFGAAVDFRVPLLAAITLDFARGHAVHADRDQRVANLVELEWLDDGDDEFHEFVL